MPVVTYFPDAALGLYRSVSGPDITPPNLQPDPDPDPSLGYGLMRYGLDPYGSPE